MPEGAVGNAGARRWSARFRLPLSGRLYPRTRGRTVRHRPRYWFPVVDRLGRGFVRRRRAAKDGPQVIGHAVALLGVHLHSDGGGNAEWHRNDILCKLRDSPDGVLRNTGALHGDRPAHRVGVSEHMDSGFTEVAQFIGYQMGWAVYQAIAINKVDGIGGVADCAGIVQVL